LKVIAPKVEEQQVAVEVPAIDLESKSEFTAKVDESGVEGTEGPIRP
jgi:hypothetical protein